MTVLQPGFFLVAAAALPILVLLYFWHRRPRTVRVPSIEVWRQVLERMPVTAVRRKRRRLPDPRLWLALLVLSLLALAAGDVSPVQLGEAPREVRVVVDRSLWMQLPVAGAESAVWSRAVADAAAWLEELDGRDRVELVFVPPLSRSERADSPAAVAAQLREAATAVAPVDAAVAAAWSAALADSLQWADAEERRRVLALTARPPARHGGDAATGERLALIRYAVSPEVVHLRHVAVDAAEIFVEVVAPPGRAVTVEAHALHAATGEVRADVEPVRREVAAVDAPDAGLVLRRFVLPRPVSQDDDDNDGVRVRVPGALPESRAIVAQPIRVAVQLPVAVPAQMRSAWLAWLAALFPALSFEPLPTEADALAAVARPDLLFVASAGTLHEQSGGFGPALSPAWRDVPRLIVGPVPAPENPFVSEGVAPVALPLQPRLKVERPEHPLLAAVSVAQLQLPEAHRMEPALGLTRFEPLLQAPLLADEADAETYVPLLAVAEDAPARAVLITGSTPLTQWPRRAGLAEALLLANSFAYLLAGDGESMADEPRILAAIYEDSRAALMQSSVAGEPFALPPWAAWRRERGDALDLAWRAADDADWQPLEEADLTTVQQRAGWLRVALPGDPSTVALLPRQAGRLEVAELQALTPAVPTTALPAADEFLPQQRTVSVQHARPWWLLLALLAATAFAVTAVYRRRRRLGGT